MFKIKAVIFITTFLFVVTTNASVNLSEIMANHKEELNTLGLDVATKNTIAAIIDNKISSTDLDNYLKVELSPRDYAKVSSIISPDEVQSLIFEIGNGANFKGNNCYSARNKALLYGGSLVAIFYAYHFVTFRDAAIEMRKQDEKYVTTQEGHILMVQLQIQELEDRGYAANNSIILIREKDIADTRILIKSIEDNFDNAGAELNRVAEKDFKIAAIAAATVTVTAISCL